MDDDDCGDFVVHMSEDRGECDVALFFDGRWIHGIEPIEYVGRALEAVGAASEGAWQQFGTLNSGVDAEAALDFVQKQIVAARSCDLPETAADSIVATLGALRRSKFEMCLAKLRRDSAFLGHIDTTGASEFRLLIAGSLAWLE